MIFENINFEEIPDVFKIEEGDTYVDIPYKFKSCTFKKLPRHIKNCVFEDCNFAIGTTLDNCLLEDCLIEANHIILRESAISYCNINCSRTIDIRNSTVYSSMLNSEVYSVDSNYCCTTFFQKDLESIRSSFDCCNLLEDDIHFINTNTNSIWCTNSYLGIGCLLLKTSFVRKNLHNEKIQKQLSKFKKVSMKQVSKIVSLLEVLLKEVA